MAFVENLTHFINADTPGYVSATVGGVAGGGLFDDDYGDPLGLVQGARRVLTVISAAFPAVAVGNTVVIGASTYSVAEIQSEHGTSRLILK